MKVNLLKIFRSKSEINLNRKVITFFICLIIAAFFWWLNVLSKDYTATLSFPIEYINFPKDRVIANALAKSIDIEVKGSGFTLLANKMRTSPEPIKIDVSEIKSLRSNSYFYLATNSLLKNFTEQLGYGIKTQKVSPDTIFFDFNPKTNKTIPVKLNISLGFEKQYRLSDSIKISPDKITISGAGSLIDKINYIETEKLVLNGINKTITIKVPLLINNNVVELSATEVMLNIPVEKYTEAEITLPIEILNLPAGYSMKTFPDKITLRYLVSFKDYENIKSNLFKAIIDYSKISPDNNNKLKVELLEFPSNSKPIQITPEKVEYIIRK